MKRHVKHERYFWIWFSYNMELDHWRDEVYWLSYTVFNNIDLTVYFTYVQMSWKMIINGGYVWIWKGEMLSDNNINFTRAITTAHWKSRYFVLSPKSDFLIIVYKIPSQN